MTVEVCVFLGGCSGSAVGIVVHSTSPPCYGCHDLPSICALCDITEKCDANHQELLFELAAPPEAPERKLGARHVFEWCLSELFSWLSFRSVRCMEAVSLALSPHQTSSSACMSQIAAWCPAKGIPCLTEKATFRACPNPYLLV